jgi:hypothetical protein
MLNGAAGEIFGQNGPIAKIFVKWQPRKCSTNDAAAAAGKIFNTSKKIIKGPQIRPPTAPGPGLQPPSL